MVLAISLLIGIPILTWIEWKHIRPREHRKEFWAYMILMVIAVALLIVQETMTLPSILEAVQHLYDPLYTVLFGKG